MIEHSGRHVGLHYAALGIDQDIVGIDANFFQHRTQQCGLVLAVAVTHAVDLACGMRLIASNADLDRYITHFRLHECRQDAHLGIETVGAGRQLPGLCCDVGIGITPSAGQLVVPVADSFPRRQIRSRRFKERNRHARFESAHAGTMGFIGYATQSAANPLPAVGPELHSGLRRMISPAVFVVPATGQLDGKTRLVYRDFFLEEPGPLIHPQTPFNGIFEGDHAAGISRRNFGSPVVNVAVHLFAEGIYLDEFFFFDFVLPPGAINTPGVQVLRLVSGRQMHVKQRLFVALGAEYAHHAAMIDFRLPRPGHGQGLVIEQHNRAGLGGIASGGLGGSLLHPVGRRGEARRSGQQAHAADSQAQGETSSAPHGLPA